MWRHHGRAGGPARRRASPGRGRRDGHLHGEEVGGGDGEGRRDEGSPADDEGRDPLLLLQFDAHGGARPPELTSALIPDSNGDAAVEVVADRGQRASRGYRVTVDAIVGGIEGIDKAVDCSGFFVWNCGIFRFDFVAWSVARDWILRLVLSDGSYREICFISSVGADPAGAGGAGARDSRGGAPRGGRGGRRPARRAPVPVHPVPAEVEVHRDARWLPPSALLPAGRLPSPSPRGLAGRLEEG